MFGHESKPRMGLFKTRSDLHILALLLTYQSIQSTDSLQHIIYSTNQFQKSPTSFHLGYHFITSVYPPPRIPVTNEGLNGLIPRYHYTSGHAPVQARSMQHCLVSAPWLMTVSNYMVNGSEIRLTPWDVSNPGNHGNDLHM